MVGYGSGECAWKLSSNWELKVRVEACNRLLHFTCRNGCGKRRRDAGQMGRQVGRGGEEK